MIAASLGWKIAGLAISLMAALFLFSRIKKAGRDEVIAKQKEREDEDDLKTNSRRARLDLDPEYRDRVRKLFERR